MTSATTIRLDDGRSLGFAEFGDPAGTAVLYLHGAHSSRNEAAAFHDNAANAGVRIVAPDRPGRGATSPHPDRTIVGYAADLAQLADSLGLASFVVAGMSNGGVYALAAAWVLGPRVDGVVMINATTPAYDAVARATLPRSARITYSLLRTAPRLVSRLSSGPPQPAARGPRGRLQERALGVDAAVLSDPQILEQTRRVAADMSGPHAAAYLAEEVALAAVEWGFDHRAVSQPVAVFTGSRDAGAAYARVWARELPNASLHEFPGGHIAFLAPAARAEIVRVMASVAGRTGTATQR